MIVRFSPYDQVAEEYYNSTAHPTCANFRELGLKFIRQFDLSEFDDRSLESPAYLETGCGMSSVVEAFPEARRLHKNLVLQDDSEKMLRHSAKWQNSIKDLLVCDARRLPFGDQEINGTFSFLADPYNDEHLWSEISRVTASGGFWLATVPSHTWAMSFRQSSGKKESRFITSDGRSVDLPSYTYWPSQLIRGLEKRGLHISKFETLGLSDISGSISDKLLNRISDKSVIDCYFFRKM